MKFIILTSVSDSKKKYYIAVNKIACVYEVTPGMNTIVDLAGCEDGYFVVQETPERIMQMIKDVTE